MDHLVEQILEASGPMPDAEAHRRYLRSLTTPQLHARLAARLAALREGQPVPERAHVEFWRRNLNAVREETPARS